MEKIAEKEKEWWKDSKSEGATTPTGDTYTKCLSTTAFPACIDFIFFPHVCGLLLMDHPITF